MIKQVIWSSTIDWPNELSTVLFFGGCNFTCSYCHNRGLSDLPIIEFGTILEKLLERKSIVDHIILSGGECTISEDFESIVNILNAHGFKIGIHTNGSNYSEFQRVRDQISFIGLDIKCFYDYYETFVVDTKLTQKIVTSIQMYLMKILEYQYEVKTVIDSYQCKEHLMWIANELKKDNIKEWILQYEVQDGKKVLHHPQDWYDDILEHLNEIIPTRIR
jgi:pyruvate formate lyase activating enzyme